MASHPQTKAFYYGPIPCCADNLKGWHCGCYNGCECCSYNWECQVCRRKFRHGVKWVVGTLKGMDILGAKIDTFKVQISVRTDFPVEQFLVYNKTRKVEYQVGADMPHGKKLKALFFEKDMLKVYVKAAYSKLRRQIFIIDTTRKQKW